jgi:hypothetical protein
VLMFAALRALDTHAQAGAQPLTVKAPFIVVDAQNKPIIKVDYPAHGLPRGIMAYSEDGAPSAQFSVISSGDGLISVRRAGGPKDAFWNAVSIGVNDEGNGSVVVRNHDRIVGELGNDTSGNGTLVVSDMAGKPIVKAQEKGTDPRGLLVLNSQGQIAAQSTVRLSGAGLVMALSESGKASASITAEANGGSVQVMNPTGVGVGALLAREGGGRIALTGPAGGKTAVGLSVEASGGKVRVYPQAGGSAQAELTAEATGGGAVTVYTTDGEAVGMLQAMSTGAGRLEIDEGKQIFVEAGVLPSGVGIVRAGPQIGGPPVGLAIPNAIMGKSGH